MTGTYPSLRDFDYQPQATDSTIDVNAIYTPPGGASTTTASTSFLIPANSTVDQVATIINNDPSSQIYATTNQVAAIGLWADTWGPEYDVQASGPSLTYRPQYSILGEEVAAPFELGGNGDISGIDAAIDAVSNISSYFGAMENRFESVMQNVASYQENLSATQSRISDADIAQESAEMTAASVLTQAATAMLTQANQENRQVLSLLA